MRTLSIKPALPTEVTLNDLFNLDLTSHYGWWVQPKLDGRRLLVVLDAREVLYFNKNGHQIEPPSTRLHTHLQSAPFPPSLGHSNILDGELVDGEYVVFGYCSNNGTASNTVLSGTGIDESTSPTWNNPETGLLWVQTWRLTERSDLGDALKRAQEMRLEGLVVKRFGGIYPPGRTKEWLKYKFYKTADVIVSEVWKGGRRAIGTAVFDGGRLVDTGGVSVPELVLERLNVGDVVECEYLYTTESDKLYQAHFLRRRNDKEPLECQLSQLIHKGKGIP